MVHTPQSRRKGLGFGFAERRGPRGDLRFTEALDFAKALSPAQLARWNFTVPGREPARVGDFLGRALHMLAVCDEVLADGQHSVRIAATMVDSDWVATEIAAAKLAAGGFIELEAAPEEDGSPSNTLLIPVEGAKGLFDFLTGEISSAV